jgi:hypothetical protein
MLFSSVSACLEGGGSSHCSVVMQRPLCGKHFRTHAHVGVCTLQYIRKGTAGSRGNFKTRCRGGPQHGRRARGCVSFWFRRDQAPPRQHCGGTARDRTQFDHREGSVKNARKMPVTVLVHTEHCPPVSGFRTSVRSVFEPFRIFQNI